MNVAELNAFTAKIRRRAIVVFQIDTTEKGNWQWGDAGVGYFGRRTAAGHEDEWAISWQCR
jgi:uncharacterized protein YwqG